MPDKYKKIFYTYYNKFIDAYRIVSNRKKIRNSWSFNDFLKPLNISASEAINPEGFEAMTFSFGDEPLVSRKSLRTEEDHISITKLLFEEQDLYKHFISDAQRDFAYSNFLQSNLNAVIALEIVISDYIRNYANSKGIDSSSIDNFIKDVGLTGNIKITLKLITPESISLPDDKIFEQCKSAITTRNKIVHKGLRTINENELEKNINSIEELIKFCKST